MNDKRVFLFLVPLVAVSLALVLFYASLPSSADARPTMPDAARVVGEVDLPYPNEIWHTVYIEDVSPDIGSTAQDEFTSRYSTRWGIMNSLSLSHPQQAISPACNYISDNAGTVVEHVAAVDPDGFLLTFYTGNNDWKVVNINEKTGVVVAKERPTCWTVQAGSDFLENIAARKTSGHVYVFTWKAGSDWVATNLSFSLGYYAVSPVTSWNAPAGSTTAEHVAFRTQDSDLVLYWRYAGGTWAAVNVSDSTGKKVAGTPFGWNMTSSTTVERIAVTDSNKHLLVFTYTPSSPWSYVDVSSKVGNKLIEGVVTAWDHNGFQYIAARGTDHHLLVFRYDPIDTTWSVKDVTAQTGVAILNDPTHWVKTVGGSTTFHIAAPADTGHIWHFYRGSSASTWSKEDVTAAHNETTYLPLTAWVPPSGFFNAKVRLAGPDPTGFMHVHALSPFDTWSAVDISTRSAGRIVYAGAPYAGVWISRDYGVTWYQSSQPQPEIGQAVVPGALNSGQILDVLVSPGDYNRVVALADRELRTNTASQAGVYVSQGGGDLWQLKHQFTCNWGVEGPSQVVVAPDDPERFYVAGGCGIARSVDAGMTWTRIMTTTNNNQRVWHLAVSGQTGGSATDRIIAACGNGDFWGTKDDGQTWRLDSGAPLGLPSGFCGKTIWGHGTAAHIIDLVPDDPTKVYIAYEHLANGPSYYHPKNHGEGPDGTFCNNPVVYDTDNDNHYDAGETKISGFNPAINSSLLDHANLKFRDLDNDHNLDNTEAVVNDADGDNRYDKDEIVLRGRVNENDILRDDNRIKYVNLGRTFGTRGCGEGSLYRGDISDLVNQVGIQRGAWSQLPGPPVYYGAGSASGAVFVHTHPTPTGFLVFFADQDTVHVSVGEPTATGWHRLDGTDASSVHRAGGSSQDEYMHVDPQGFAVSPDFDLTLKAVTDQSFPYNQNSELDTCGGGRIWISNDGGINHSDNCGATEARWRAPNSGLNTLVALNIQGATSLDLSPALYFGTADNDDFYSMDAGDTWKTAVGLTCGDCDTWFGDLYQVNRVLRLQPRANSGAGAFDLHTNPAMDRPDAGQASQISTVNYPNGVRPYSVSSLVMRGYRPAVQTIPTGTPPADGDYIAIQAAGANEHYLMRANDRISTSGLARSGARIPTLQPNNIPPNRPLWAQAGGGHASPDFYLGDGTRLWRGQDPVTSWQQVVPTGTLTAAWRYFANPYDASMIYLLTPQGVYHSTDSGGSWQHDQNLQNAVTDNGDWRFSCWDDNCLINDMVFDPTHANRRFAAGVAGVFFTADGQNWFRLLDTRALPSRPRGMWFDPLSDPNDDSLYVASNGRGILRLHPIPSSAPVAQQQPPPPPPTPTPTPTPLPPGSGHTVLKNGGFEDGHAGWTFGGSASLSESMTYSGGVSAQLGHEGASYDGLKQTIDTPCGVPALTLSYRVYISSVDNHPSLDNFTVSVESEGQSTTLQHLTEEDPQGNWSLATFDLTELQCQPVTVKFESNQNSQLVTSFFVDDVKLLAYDGFYYLNMPLLLR